MQQGAACVFVRNGGAWIQEQDLAACDGAGNDELGCSVSLSGGTVVMGANRGAAYVFVRSGTAWSQQQELTSGGGSVSLSGDTAVIGAIGKDVAGAAGGFGWGRPGGGPDEER